MEDWQRKHIRSNLPQLLKDTTVNQSLIAELTAEGVLGTEDVNLLESIGNKSERTAQFYQIVQTRLDSYDLLKQALEKTNQTGAYDLLNFYIKQDILSGRITQTKTVLGEQGSEYSVSELVVAIGRSGQVNLDKLQEEWPLVANDLNVDPVKIRSLGRELLLEKITLLDLLCAIIKEWVAGSYNSATLDKLLRVLHSRGLRNCAENLAEELFGSYLQNSDAETMLDMMIKGIIDSRPKTGYRSAVVTPKKSEGFGACLGSIFTSSSELLFEAIIRHDPKTVVKLVQRGADVNARNKNGMTPLHVACERFHRNDDDLEIIKFLIDNGADVWAKADKRTFFDIIILNRRTLPFHDLCECMVFNNHVAFFNVIDEDLFRNFNAFMHAVKVIDVESRTLKLLYENGLDVDVVDENGWTALFYAISRGRSARLVRNLVELEMGPKRRNNAGQTPYQFCREKWGQTKYKALNVLEIYN